MPSDDKTTEDPFWARARRPEYQAETDRIHQIPEGVVIRLTAPTALTIQDAIDGLVASGEWAAAQALVAERERQAQKTQPAPPLEKSSPVQGDWWRGVR